MKCKLICVALFAVGVAFLAAPARAALFAEGQAGPATNAAALPGAATQGAVTSLKVTVVDVSGNVQVRSGDEQPWQVAKVGMEVNEGAEFRTGLRSSVRCTIPPDQSGPGRNIAMKWMSRLDDFTASAALALKI